MIPVTKPFLPPREEYDELLNGVWSRNWLTNNGPLVNELELALKKYFGLKHLFFVSNGTIALQLAIKALGLKGQIITTPFSYVATTSSIVWEGCTPVFVDIDPASFNMNPDLIEAAITPETTAILATHVYGNACDVERIQAIAQKHRLKIIYDGAHAFGTKYKNETLFRYGDVSTLSFHATKLFHTIEGGAVVVHDADLAYRVAKMRNFGHSGPEVFDGVGINGKNSEFHAAMGLCNLKYVNDIIENRKRLGQYYHEKLKNLKVQKPEIHPNCTWNYAYYPILFESEKSLLKAQQALVNSYISPRRYFYPTLNSLDYIGDKGNTPVADDIAKRILCLPMYDTLSREEIDMISRLLLRVQNY